MRDRGSRSAAIRRAGWPAGRDRPAIGDLPGEPIAFRQWPREIGRQLRRCGRPGGAPPRSTPAKRLGSIERRRAGRSFRRARRRCVRRGGSCPDRRRPRPRRSCRSAAIAPVVEFNHSASPPILPDGRRGQDGRLRNPDRPPIKGPRRPPSKRSPVLKRTKSIGIRRC